MAAVALVAAASVVGDGFCSGPVIGCLIAVKLAGVGVAVGGRVEVGKGLAAAAATAAIYILVSS